MNTPTSQGREFLTRTDPAAGLDGSDGTRDALLGVVLSAMAAASSAGLNRHVILDQLVIAADVANDYITEAVAP